MKGACHDRVWALQEQPFEVLAMLVTRPGELALPEDWMGEDR